MRAGGRPSAGSANGGGEMGGPRVPGGGSSGSQPKGCGEPVGGPRGERGGLGGEGGVGCPKMHSDAAAVGE